MSLRKRLQRQLEFYMSESNIRQDTFLRHEMDDDGFVPVHVFLTFNKLKVLKATERMILDEAEKSSLLRADRVRCCIAPKTLPLFGQMDDVDARTLYFDNFSALDNHESLRQTFARFGKVNLVSLPRFPRSKKFKGFGFVEYSEKSIADKAVRKSLNIELGGIRVMIKTRWIEMKKQLKTRLAGEDVAAACATNEASELSNTEPGSEKKGNKRQKLMGSDYKLFSSAFKEEGNGRNNRESIYMQKA